MTISYRPSFHWRPPFADAPEPFMDLSLNENEMLRMAGMLKAEKAHELFSHMPKSLLFTPEPKRLQLQRRRRSRPTIRTLGRLCSGLVSGWTSLKFTRLNLKIIKNPSQMLVKKTELCAFNCIVRFFIEIFQQSGGFNNHLVTISPVRANSKNLR